MVAVSNQQQVTQSYTSGQYQVHQLDDQTLAKLVSVYGKKAGKLTDQLIELAKKISDRQAAGEQVPVSWLMTDAQVKALLVEVEAHTQVLVDKLAGVVPDAKTKAINAAQTVGQDIGVGFTLMPREAVQQMVAQTLYPDAWVNMAGMPDQTTKMVRGVLLNHVISGRSVPATAQKLKTVMGIPLHKAMTIARTETMYAYNHGAIATYQQNKHLVPAWVWLTAEDDKVCPYCAPRDKQEYDLGTPFATHPNCRCTTMPKVDFGAVEDAGPPLPDYLQPGTKQFNADNILFKKTGGQAGSNPGGFYQGKDGKAYYDKTYVNPDQGQGEVIANTIYNALGVHAPSAGMYQDAQGKWHYASQVIDGAQTIAQLGLTKQRAQAILDGWAADVLLGNWDAVGLSFDNVVEAGGAIHRIDNGGSLLYRAQGMKKDKVYTQTIKEWETLAPGPGNKNGNFAKVWNTAGFKSVEEYAPQLIRQIQAIEDLHKSLPGGWKALVDAKSPGISTGDRNAVIDMLETKTQLLAAKRAELEAMLAKKQAPAAPPVQTVVTAPAPVHPGKVTADQWNKMTKKEHVEYATAVGINPGHLSSKELYQKVEKKGLIEHVAPPPPAPPKVVLPNDAVDYPSLSPQDKLELLHQHGLAPSGDSMLDYYKMAKVSGLLPGKVDWQDWSTMSKKAHVATVEAFGINPGHLSSAELYQKLVTKGFANAKPASVVPTPVTPVTAATAPGTTVMPTHQDEYNKLNTKQKLELFKSLDIGAYNAWVNAGYDPSWESLKQVYQKVHGTSIPGLVIKVPKDMADMMTMSGSDVIHWVGKKYYDEFGIGNHSEQDLLNEIWAKANYAPPPPAGAVAGVLPKSKAEFYNQTDALIKQQLEHAKQNGYLPPGYDYFIANPNHMSWDEMEKVVQAQANLAANPAAAIPTHSSKSHIALNGTDGYDALIGEDLSQGEWDSMTSIGHFKLIKDEANTNGHGHYDLATIHALSPAEQYALYQKVSKPVQPVTPVPVHPAPVQYALDKVANQPSLELQWPLPKNTWTYETTSQQIHLAHKLGVSDQFLVDYVNGVHKLDDLWNEMVKLSAPPAPAIPPLPKTEAEFNALSDTDKLLVFKHVDDAVYQKWTGYTFAPKYANLKIAYKLKNGQDIPGSKLTQGEFNAGTKPYKIKAIQDEAALHGQKYTQVQLKNLNPDQLWQVYNNLVTKYPPTPAQAPLQPPAPAPKPTLPPGKKLDSINDIWNLSEQELIGIAGQHWYDQWNNGHIGTNTYYTELKNALGGTPPPAAAPSAPHVVSLNSWSMMSKKDHVALAMQHGVNPGHFSSNELLAKLQKKGIVESGAVSAAPPAPKPAPAPVVLPGGAMPAIQPGNPASFIGPLPTTKAEFNSWVYGKKSALVKAYTGKSFNSYMDADEAWVAFKAKKVAIATGLTDVPDNSVAWDKLPASMKSQILQEITGKTLSSYKNPKAAWEDYAITMGYQVAPPAPPPPLPQGIAPLGSYKQFKDANDGYNYGTAYWKAADLKASQRAAMKKFTGGYYSTINNALWRGKGNPGSEAATAAQIDAGMKPTTEPVAVWRGDGGGMFDGDSAMPVVGKTYHNDGYMSTSMADRAAFGGKYHVHLHLPPGIYGFYVKPFSNYGHENEWLCGRGYDYMVTGIRKNTRGTGHSYEVDVVVIPRSNYP